MDPDNFNFPYTATDLTEQVNRIPNSYGLLLAMGLFSSEGVISTTVEIHMEDGILKVLPAKERGAPGTLAGRETGKTLFFKVPHFPHRDLILPKDIQDILIMAGRMKRPNTLADELAKRLNNIRNNHSITLEYVRMGALKGVIKEGAGAELYNLFDEFDITKKTVDFVLGTAGTDVIAKCEEVSDHIISNLKGEVSNGVEIQVSGSFFNKLVQHAKVEKYWVQTQQAQQIANMERDRLGGNWGRVFDFQNIRFRENKTTFPIEVDGAMTSEAAIAAGYGHAYPTGTVNTFKTWFAPADTMAALNAAGDEIFISPEILDHGKGIDLWSESNPLAICQRPEVLVEVNTSN
ncbi:MAG: major capsid protein [Devosia nanyangense]|uniref:Major capsid protein n=1 Tax=Devosia nanyangense TaxID=1228055 RepID=A0A933NYV3_9HYPH|nr:major capsid protein [Devosia nanyangense]